MKVSCEHNPARRLRPAAWAFLAAGVFCYAGSALAAEDAGKAGAEASRSTGAGLADRESIVRDRVARLEDRMFQLSQALRKSDPQKAQRLLDGLGALRGEQIRERVGKIVERLRGEEFADAVDQQRAVVSDLQGLLKLLLEDPNNLKQRKEELSRLEAFGKTLDRVIREQEKELSNARAAQNAAQRAAALEAAAKKLEDLIRRQADAAEQTGRGAAPKSQMARRQAAIRGRTEGLSRDVKSACQGAPGDESQESKPSDDADAAQKNLDNATKKMRSAEKQLEKGHSGGAKSAQQGAAADMEQAKKHLVEAARKIRQKLELKKQAEAQRKTAEKTNALGRKMKGAKAGKSGGGSSGSSGGKKGQKGGKKGGQTGSQGQQNAGEPAPGQEGVEQAVPLQRDAAEKLEKKDSAKAAKKQSKALKKLKSAKEALADRLEQLRREQQEELLAALESRFRAMLSRQLECNKGTNRLADLGPAHWKRSDQLELAELSQRQRWVGDQADEALYLLVEEGTTVVLPKLVTQVRDDGRAAAERLAAAAVGPTLRMMQMDIEQVLRDIIGAIKKKQEALENGGGGSGSSGGKSPPLLPGSAELKLLRACQVRVNKVTEQLADERSTGGETAEEINAQLKQLAKRQADVAAMAKDMHEAMKRAQ